jgi:uncharacterized protein (DUF4415 family)
MQEPDIKRASLSDLRKMAERGELRHDPDASERPDLDNDLPQDFWANAVLVEPSGRKSVHLRLQPEVFEFFLKQTGGKGHIAKMQAVLKAYADAHRETV